MKAKFLLLLLLVLLASVACAKKGPGEPGAGGKDADAGGAPKGPPPVPVNVEPVQLKPYAPAFELVGEIRATQQATLAAEVSGKVLKIAHRVGELAPKGQPLIIIDPASYQAGLASAQASLEQARQQLAQAQAGPRSQVIAAQEAAVAAAQARLDEANDNLSRQQQLFDQGVISESALVTARSQADAAQAGLEQEQQRLGELQAGSRPEEIDAARANVDAAQAQVQLAQLSLQRSKIAPPFDAMVGQLMVEEGQFVGPGTPLAQVVAGKGENLAVEAWFAAPEAQAQKIHAGDAVELRSTSVTGPDGKPIVIDATVASVAPSADPITRQFPIRVSVSDSRLRPGMAAHGRILAGQPKPTLMASEDATYESKLGLLVYRMVPPGPDDKPAMPGMPALPSVESVPVETGQRLDGLVVITKGDLKPGDMLVTRGKEGLYPGAHIIPSNLQQGGPPGKDDGAGAPAGKPPEDAAAAGENAGATTTETEQGKK